MNTTTTDINKGFDSFDLPNSLKESLVKINFTKPTPIQLESIPFALKGLDIIGSARTGTGKTAAFGIPVVAYLISNPKNSVMIITPTRELASQVMDHIRKMTPPSSKIKAVLLIGGDNIGKQKFSLEKNPKPNLIIGTPGRINDLLERGCLSLDSVGLLVLDETDRMLDMGFSIQIDKIINQIPKKRQTLLFSATFPKNIIRIAEKYLKNPVKIQLNNEDQCAEKIKQEVLFVQRGEKSKNLLSQVEQRSGSIIVFVKTKDSTERIAVQLAKSGQQAFAINGNLHQKKRERIIKSFRSKKFRVLVATDIVARGLDVSHVEHVINYDLPNCAEDYIHRIGRTARAGAQGSSLCFIAPDEKKKWNLIKKSINSTNVQNRNNVADFHKSKKQEIF